jgi:hypothetical protein
MSSLGEKNKSALKVKVELWTGILLPISTSHRPSDLGHHDNTRQTGKALKITLVHFVFPDIYYWWWVGLVGG